MDRLSRPLFEFAGYRLDVTAQLLIAPDGRPISLSSRAFDTLRYLVERSGELVEKADLMRAIWPRTVVEENNLSQCIVAIRKALGEEASERKFILTVPGRGYKFVAPVRILTPEPPAAWAVETPAPMPVRSADPPVAGPAAGPSLAGPRAAARWWRWAVIGAGISAAVLVTRVATLRLRDQAPSAAAAVTSPAEYQPLTDVPDSAVQPALSPDGRLLAFIRGADAFMGAGQIWLKVLPSGESIQLTHEKGSVFAPTFTPDGAHVAYSVADKEHPGAPWETWTVPITGGEPTLFLPNASALSFLGPHEVMYSEFKAGVHLGIVTSLDDRTRHREVYLPDHERGMAHFSYLSPDRKSVLIVEMGGDGRWQRCRLVPFDGSSAGRAVGPGGACTSAAWSPNGRWMYFAARVASHSHLWRQRFPDGEPEQITFGPTEEVNVAIAPDGRSLLTSVGQWQSTIWIHDRARERPLATEGFAYAPRLSADDRRVYYLAARYAEGGAELSRVNEVTGLRESLLPGFAVSGYDVSRDERLVAFTVARQGVSEIWVAPLDRRTPPVRLVRGGDQVAFDAAGRVYFRSLGAHENHLHRMNADGSGEVTVLNYPIADFQAVSPDGNWAIVGLPMTADIGGEFLAPVTGHSPHLLVTGYWPVRWSRDGKLLYLEIGAEDQPGQEGRTLAVRLGTSGLPAGPIRPQAAHAVVIPHAEQLLSIGSNLAYYVYVKADSWQNIYRIPLH